MTTVETTVETTVDEETSVESTTSSTTSSKTTWSGSDEEDVETTTTSTTRSPHTSSEVEDYEIVTKEIPIIKEIRHIITNDSVIEEQLGWNISIYCVDMFIDSKVIFFVVVLLIEKITSTVKP